MGLPASTHDVLALVPIVVNAGAAILPAFAAALATTVALLFKPRELVRAIRRKPHVPVIIVAAGAGLWLAVAWLAGGEAEPRNRRRAASPAEGRQGVVVVDWTQVALEIIRTEKAAAAPGVAATGVGGQPAPRTGESATIFRGGPSRRGWDGGPAPTGLRMLWQYYARWKSEDGTEKEDPDSMILSSPVVHGDRVYGASCLLDPPGNYGTVFCLDAATGRKIWSVDTIDGKDLRGFFSSPAVTADGRYVVIGQGLHPDANCRLICLETATGRVHWTLPISLHIESSPAIEGDVVVVGAGAIEDATTHKPVSHPGFVLCVRIADGKELWRQDLADPESSPVIADGVAYIGSGFNGQALAALRIAPSDELGAKGLDRLAWKYDTDYPVTGAVTLAGDMVVVGGGNGDFVYRDPDPAGMVLALDRATGRLRWRTGVEDAVLGAIAAGEDILVCPVASGEVLALSRADGKVLWRQRVSDDAAILAAPALAGGFVYAVSKDGYLARLSAADGSILEKVYVNATETPGALGLTLSSPFVAGGRLYVGSETGGLRCYGGSN